MRKKKKKISIVFAILLVVLGIYVLNYYGFFEGEPKVLTVVSDCPGNTLCKESASPFSCPPDADFCMVQGSIDCMNPTSVQNVFARTDDIDYSSGWIAILGDNGYLESWVRKSSGENNREPVGEVINLPLGIKGVKNSNNEIVIRTGQGQFPIYTKYTKGGAADLTPTPKEPYTSNGLEVIIGVEPYSCGSTFQVKKSDGIVKDFQVIDYSQNTPWTDKRTSKIFRVEKGELAEFTGGTYSATRIYYNENVIKETCTRDYCEGNSVRKCEAGVPGEIVVCNFGCSDGKCIEPFTVDTIIKDSRGFEKTSIGKNSPFSIIVTIKSSSSFSDTFNFELREGGISGSTYYSTTKQFTTNTPVLFNFPDGIPITDKYYIVLSVNYPNALQPIDYGINPGEYSSLDVVDEFTATLRISQVLGSVERRNNFFVGYPLKVEYLFQEGGDTPALPDSAIVSYEVASSKTTLQNPLILTDNRNGYYVYEFTPIQQGEYIFTAQATRGAFQTPLITDTYSVKNDQVVIDYNLFYDQAVTNKFYSKLLSWTTKNRDGQLIDTSNVVSVRINGVDSGTVPVQGSGGNYYIDYTFTKDNADYIFFISSQSSIAGITSGEVSTELIKSGSQEETICTIDSCGFFEQCNSDTGQCETKISLIVFVFGGIFGMVILILLINKLRKSRKQPNLGGDFNL